MNAQSIIIAIGDVQCDQNEAQRSFIITTILVAAVNSVSNTILHTKIIGSLNYAIERIYSQSVTEEIVYITIAKQNNIKEGIAQNIMQIRSAIEVCSSVYFFFIEIEQTTDIKLHCYRRVTKNTNLMNCHRDIQNMFMEL